MAEPGKRRIVKRVVLTAAAVALLLVSYLGSWFSMHWLYGRGTIGPSTFYNLRSTVFAPVALFCISELPGSEFVSSASDSCVIVGESVFTIDFHFDWSPDSSGDQFEISQDED